MFINFKLPVTPVLGHSHVDVSIRKKLTNSVRGSLAGDTAHHHAVAINYLGCHVNNPNPMSNTWVRHENSLVFLPHEDCIF
jgi:hypothetical protein